MGSKLLINSIPKNIIYELGIETTKILNNKQNELQNLTWQIGEANTDIGFSQLACSCCKYAWEIVKNKFPIYDKIDIICKIPDINLEFLYNNSIFYKDKIELKSSKKKKINGSTIRILDINQTLIYCYRPDNKPYEIRCSQYFTAMCNSNFDRFQDRTPRPHIDFNRMNKIDKAIPFLINNDSEYYIEHYVKCALERIKNPKKCRQSWQDDLVILLKEKIIKDYITQTSENQFKIDKMQLKNK